MAGLVLLFTWLLVHLLQVDAHYIQIDHEEFRASGFPHPHFPPPPLTPLDHLPQVLAAKELTPAEVMVDLTNDLTHRLLHYHSILNRNNFAFSPTALVSVLVALFEGSAGNTAEELRHVLQLPNNRDVTRVGYRDIHRRLRTYFFGSDNPLKGLSLNKGNVTVLKDFETVLMFYGYDLSVDMLSSTPANLTSDAELVNTTMASNTTTMEMDAETTTSKDAESTTEEPATTTTEPPATTTAEPPTTTTETPAETEATTEAPAATSGEEEAAEPAGEDEAAELVSAFVAEEDSEPLLRIQKARVSRLPTSKLQAPLKHSNPITPKPIYLPSARTVAMPMPMMARQVAERKPPGTRQVISIIAPSVQPANISVTRKTKTARYKRHAIPAYKDLDANLFLTLFNPHTHVPHHPLHFPPPVPAAFAPITNDFEPHYIGEAAEGKSNYNTDVISHVFYLGNQQVVHTTFKVYNAVLYYKYFEHLKMSVLELELDTPEYNLMILLPDYHTDIVAAAASLKLGPTLRLMRKQLKPRWVQAIIPDFKLHGTMFLTNDLQNMGICDVFEPNRADFRPMTEEKGVYVRHIEQSIDVTIRTHPINQLKRNYGAQSKPIQISVNHPFLFFIVDRDLDVAVMSGRILNPLNVRIQ
uniref:Serpin 85F n=1 Tax=Drosophila melanogaster TaxID=7227 RepID=Q9VH46_DROME|nr:serpin 85F [Drosophila melanogaster]AAF54473.3 serpin 85F [Drosophila melanogaster]|eukprot:NP_649965.2 serpin 85F [Drosophila melanogaster]